MVKTAILVSGGGTNLQAIIDEKAKGNLPNAEISLLLCTNPNAYALQRAKNAPFKINMLTVNRSNYTNPKDFDKQLLKALKYFNIQLIVLAGFMSILGEEIVKKYDKRIINVHPSLIPSFCGKGYYGLKVHRAALEKGVKITGATVHYVNEIPDDGEIILQKAVKVYKNDTEQSLQQRVMKQAEWKILPKALNMITTEMCDKKKNSTEK